MELKNTISDKFFLRWCPNPTSIYDLGEIYAEYNAKFFYGTLKTLNVVERTDKRGNTTRIYTGLKWDGRLKNFWGIYRPNGRGTGEIRISRQAAMQPHQVRDTILHEMLHKWLDMKGLDDGIEGHGPHFIDHSLRINQRARELGLTVRVNFFNEEITKEQPEVYSELLKTTLYCGRDLDIARKMRGVFDSAFHESYSTVF